VFPHRHVVLPVIHVKSEQQAERNANIAAVAGADGVFLINHAGGSDALLNIASAVAGQFSGLWVGVNCLDLEPIDVFARVTDRVSGVRVDNAMIQEDRPEQPAEQAILEAKRASGIPEFSRSVP
jgi:hypothetical protein